MTTRVCGDTAYFGPELLLVLELAIEIGPVRKPRTGPVSRNDKRRQAEFAQQSRCVVVQLAPL